MNIVILRHGEAESVADTDVDRQLTSRGRADVRKAAQCLLRQTIAFDQAWVSPYVRTQQTADEVLSVYNHVARHTLECLVPDSDPGTVMQQLASSDAQNLLIVSHQPLVSTLVGLLVGANGRYGPPMSPASMACLHADVVAPGCCTLTWLRHAPDFEISH